ncbi:hypothetical protein TVAG_219180 [Trichomonas vaginalis G3]|uniref:Uncharacterized protein n=1 Tax=Trichomonas vaginalis (strain ATCC PRA-98 / G3) TaxID=412133 RepID=A2FKQ0_TRIV3|nr:hypothetical protein TVAGG3_0866890 [Trichomonas vaginalis G3]EAX94512.1 hypothetical protein TVAG_219180 [Trichomonas vaginalis G3]KAI5501094.1 hypothetical protein TVAGG3_0866890 [Trichomonas vaginalis G3]|eukprot:XP_001307442.1 hypothetical protein [Trichomonas vaginalis G3]
MKAVLSDFSEAIKLIEDNKWDDFIKYAIDERNNAIITQILANSKYENLLIQQMTKEQLLEYLGNVKNSTNIMKRISKIADSDSKFTEVAKQLVLNPYKAQYTNTLSYSISSLPIDMIKTIISSRVTNSEIKDVATLGSIIKIHLDGKHNFKLIQERDSNDVKKISIEITRKSVLNAFLDHLSDVLDYIQTLNNKSSLIRSLLSFPIENISNCINKRIMDDEMKAKLTKIFIDFPVHKVFPELPAKLINFGDIDSQNQLERMISKFSSIIKQPTLYQLFKKAVDAKHPDFIKYISQNLFKSEVYIYIRALNSQDGVFDKLFEFAIQQSVEDFIQTGESKSFNYVCGVIFNHTKMYLKYDEIVKFINEVCKRVIELKESLLTNTNKYPSFCLQIIKVLLNPNDRKISNFVNSEFKTPFELLDKDIRNSIVVGAIKHPTDDKKFSDFISSHECTYLFGLICKLNSIFDIHLVLSESKKSSIDKYSMMNGKLPVYPNPIPCKMSIVEVFLQMSNFWLSDSDKLVREGYLCYQLLAKKFVNESLKSDDKEFKEIAALVYQRFLTYLFGLRDAKNLQFRADLFSDAAIYPPFISLINEIDPEYPINLCKTNINNAPTLVKMQILQRLLMSSHYENSKIDAVYGKISNQILQMLMESPLNKFDINGNFNVNWPEIFDYDWKELEKKFLNASNIDVPDYCNVLINDDVVDFHMLIPDVELEKFKTNFTPNYFVYYEIVQKLYQFVITKKYVKKKIDETTEMFMNFQEFLIKNSSKILSETITLDLLPANSEYNYYSIKLYYHPAFFPMINELHKDYVLDFKCIDYLFNFDFKEGKLNDDVKFEGFPFTISFDKNISQNNLDAKYQKEQEIKRKIYDDFKSHQKSFNQITNKSASLEKNLKNIMKNDKITFVIEKNTNKLEKEKTQQIYFVPRQVLQVIKAFDKCDSELFVKSAKCLMTFQSNEILIRYGKFNENCSFFTSILNLLLVEITGKNVSLDLSKEGLGFSELLDICNSIAQICSWNLGDLPNLELLQLLNLQTCHQRFRTNANSVFQSILMSNNIQNIIKCFQCHLFSELFFESTTSLSDVYKNIVEYILKNKETTDIQIIKDEYLAKLAIVALDMEFPKCDKYLTPYLQFISERSLICKRSAVANAIYYTKLCRMYDYEIPNFDDILRKSFTKFEDEMTIFYCLLINYDKTLEIMNKKSVFAPLSVMSCRPEYYLNNSSFRKIEIGKENTDLYSKIIDEFLLKGLLSHTPHIVELIVSLLSFIELSNDHMKQIISNYVDEGLKNINVAENKEEFIKFATIFVSKHFKEYENCFKSFEETLSKIKQYSLRAIKEESSKIKMNKKYVPEQSQKIKNIYNTISNVLEEIFIKFENKSEMKSTSEFCRQILQPLTDSKPFGNLRSFNELLSKVKLFGDVNFEKCCTENQDQLKYLILCLQNNNDVGTIDYKVVSNIFEILKAEFNEEHTLLLSKLPNEYKYNKFYCNLFKKSLSENIPDVDDEKLAEILSDLGDLLLSDETEEMTNLINNEEQDYQVQAREALSNYMPPGNLCQQSYQQCPPMQQQIPMHQPINQSYLRMQRARSNMKQELRNDREPVENAGEEEKIEHGQMFKLFL